MHDRGTDTAERPYGPARFKRPLELLWNHQAFVRRTDSRPQVAADLVKFAA